MDVPRGSAVEAIGRGRRAPPPAAWYGCRCVLLVLLPLVMMAVSPQGQADPAPSRSRLSLPRFDAVGADVIPRDVVSALAQDRQGFLWVGTGDGLLRYDGYRFRPLERSTADAAGRSLGWVASMSAAADGRMWIAPESGGVALYDPATEQVVDAPAWAPGEQRPAVLSLIEAEGGGVWVGTQGRGLLRLDGQGRRMPLPGVESLAGQSVQSLVMGDGGELWVGTWRGLWRYASNTGRLSRITVDKVDLDSLAVHALLRSADGRVWAGMRQGVLLRSDGPGAGGVRVLASPEGESVAGAAIRAMVEVEGELWIGRDRGIDRVDVVSGALKGRIRHDPRRPDGLAGNDIFTMLRDEAGSIWVGGPGLGLQRHDPRQRGIWVRGADPVADSPLADPDVRSLLRLADGRIWAATRDRGLAILDEDLQVQARMAWPVAGPGDAGLGLGLGARASVPQVDAMAQDARGDVWLASSTTLISLDTQGRGLSQHELGAPVRTVLGGRDGRVWVGTRDGLYRTSVSPSQGLQRVAVVAEDAAAAASEVAAWTDSRATGAALTGDVYALAEADDGSLWVGTDRGLFLRPPGDERLHAVQSPPGEGLGSQAVIGLLIDREGRLWVDTAVAGLHRLVARHGLLARFDGISLRLGQAGRPFGANLMEDGRGRIWTHMHRYDPATDRMQPLTAADGVRFGTGWFGSHARTASGRLLFGGSEGLLVVDADEMDAVSYVPPLRLAELRVDGRREPAWRPGQALSLPSGARSVSAEAAALHYSDPRRVRYTWRLQGYETAWVVGGEGQRTASYGNLPPGHYQLQMRAHGQSGPWQSDELTLAIEVMPAWWQTWWLRTLVAMLVGTGIWALVQWRTRRLRADQTRLEDLVRARTRELEDSARALEQSSLTDPLTGLRNRRYLAQHLEPEVQLVQRRIVDRIYRGQPMPDDDDLLFFLIDIDHFKDVNDTHGHAAGDAVLMAVADRLRAVFRESDHLVRWGGEEFLVVARGSSRREAAALAERVRHEVAGTSFDLGGGARLTRTCSIGFAAFPLAMSLPRAIDWTAAVALADRALYVAKRSGRDGWFGLVESRASDVDALRSCMGRSITTWVDEGDLTVQASMPPERWREAARHESRPEAARPAVSSS